MIGTDWMEHRREDGEPVGWIRPAGDDFVPIDLFGHELGEPMDWMAAEALLEERGLRWLAEPWALHLDDGSYLRVRLVEVSPDGILVKTDDFGAVDAPKLEYRLPFPAPPTLRPWDPREYVDPFQS